MKIQKSDWLSKRITALGKSKSALASVLGMRPQHVDRLLLKIKLTPQQFSDIAKFLNVDEKNLIDFWANKISEEKLFDKQYTTNNKEAVISKDDLVMLLSLIEGWLDSIDKVMPIGKKIELAYLIYDDVRVLPRTEWKAEVIKFSDILYRANALEVSNQ